MTVEQQTVQAVQQVAETGATGVGLGAGALGIWLLIQKIVPEIWNYFNKSKEREAQRLDKEAQRQADEQALLIAENAANRKAFQEAMDKMVDVFKSAAENAKAETTHCYEKYERLQSELLQISAAHAELKGKVDLMETFKPQEVIKQLSDAFSSLVDRRKD